MTACPPPPPLVRTTHDRRTLEFSPGEVQSEMCLAAPDALVLAYTRAMMCFTLFVPHPRHIVMVGLGGGSLLKFCHRHFPGARITVIELRADVIALRAQFAIPPDDARLSVLQGDAALLLPALAERADVIMVDGFGREGMPAQLASARFYGHCRRQLHEGGILVANILSYDPRRTAAMARLGLIFNDHVCRLTGVAGNNHVVFAVKAASGAAGELLPAVRRARRLARRRGPVAGWRNRLLVAWQMWRLGRLRLKRNS
ncbi:transferase spermidine synthase [Massilia sp. PAMC28688]|uniref:spermine/spermidine synthase domain-containing protein n=1 Tax=Massilia sp. PAMC28688 TaxID=2861283 RepID=UPI001C62998F|nr:transferase spermidine synthase [Massilia sp. PAMC28688]QYF93644.1 transferase spermidine synthase [Massilia sp. PAMC28688]